MRLSRLIGIVSIAAAATAATCAAAGGPPTGGTAGSAFSPDGRLSYIAVPHRNKSTTLQLWRDAHRIRAVKIHGYFGFPIVAADGLSEGVSRDGNTLVLATGQGHFRLLDAHTLRLLQVVKLPSQFSYDALSPHARMLYLIQHVASPNSNRYYVRAYDLKFRRLQREPIFDTREKWSLMSGMPVTRATSASGRWVYTLYTRPGGKPFVHSLDSTHRAAVCVDLPWMQDQSRLFGMRLELSRGEGKLRLLSGNGVVATIDTRTFRVS
jgi:hypothetical protein